MKLTPYELKESIYNSLFSVTELALESFHHYIPELYEKENTIKKALFIDSIKRVTHKQKKRAQNEVDSKKQENFILFFKGVHIENIRQICLRMRIEMQNIQKTKTEPQILKETEELQDFLESMIEDELILIKELINEMNE